MAASASSPRLTILGGPHAGQELTLDEAVDNILVGSDPSCRFHIDLPGVSPIHARLWVDWQGLTVYDTGAPEGVYLNDDRVERSALVRNGDFLWLGSPGGDGVVLIQCRVPPRAAAPPVSQPEQPPATAPAASAALAGDATATLITAPRSEAESAAGAFTDTIAFTADMAAGEAPEEAVTYEPEPDDAGAVETAWITPANETEAPLEPEAIVEPDAVVEPDTVVDLPTPVAAASETFATPIAPAEPSFEAETVVLRAGAAPEADVTPVAGVAPADDVTEIIDEPVKFEIDEPPPALASHPALFEEDIEESPTLVAEPVDKRPEAAAAETVVVPPPLPAPVVAPQPARVPPPSATPRVATPPPTPPAPQPIPRAVAPRPSPAPAATKPAPARAASGAGRYLALVAVIVIVLAAGGFAAYHFLLSPAPAPPAPTGTATAAPPVTLAQAQVEEPAAPTPVPSAPLEEAVTIVPTPPAAGPTPAAPTPTPKATPSARPGPTPKPGVPGAPPTPAPAPEAARELPAAQAAALVTQGDSALAEHRYDAAAALYAQALQLDPQNAQALAGRTRAQAGAAAAKRSFVAGRSVLVGAKSGKKGPAGFDDEDVQVAKAPDYSGRIEFEASPRSLKPGDSYTVRIFLVNDGKKDFKIAAFSAVTSANGEKSGGPMAPATRDVATQKRELVQELSGVWKEGLNAWSLEAAVTSSHGEVVRNTLTWK